MGKIFGRYLKGDRTIWLVVFFLSAISLLAVYSSTGTLAYKYYGGNTSHFLLKQLGFLIFSLVVVFIAHLISYKVYYPFSTLLMGISIPLLLFTLVFGTQLNEASRWIEIPGLGITLQSSDVAKFSLVLYVAKVLSQYQKEPINLKQLTFKLMLPIALICVLILPANFSTAVLVGITCWLLMFVGRVKLRHLLGFTGVGAMALAILILVALQFNTIKRVHTWKTRIESFASSENDESNYQVEQSKIAIATGGIFGKGPGKSTQRNFLPHPYSDFIYSIIVEEYGWIGAIGIIMLYMILLYRAALIVKKSKRTFPALLAFGLALLIVLQAFVNMAVAVNLIPVTGQPLPLVSMGGTSLFFSSAAFGIILSISRTQSKKELFDGEEPVEDNN
ncbi:MAG: FtsW/RodA/SpoVE family cell cycle protein [Bacteroidales bacterium]|nr:FtsW/RodA/SpoVE family cell cycle protein [Bacteroidales bacterium]HPD95529.1 FtsW/RodA/SpoVE family cell cycle protein [Tenuifilaceae bacterium]HRX31128.1 FtsW/RodA/SpoVE family cell cycle protein [Tenuifilaceae bacterium]